MELNPDKNLLQTIFDSAAIGVVMMQNIMDKTGKVEDFSITLFNANALKWIGETKSKNKKFSEVFPTETEFLKKLIAVAESGISTNFERKYTNDATKTWFRFTVVKYGKHLLINIEDITEWKQTELAFNEALDALEKQKRLSDSITNNTPDLVYVFDLTYKFTYANKALLLMWGKTAEDAIGKGLRENGYEEWHAKMHEDEIDHITIHKKPIRGTVSFPHAEFGRRIYDYILVPVLNEQGDVEAIAGTTRDITEIKITEENLQLSEGRLKSVIDQTPAPNLVLMGDNLIIEQINKPMLQMIGHGEEVIGTPLLSVLPELAGQYIWEQVLKVYTEGIPFDHSEALVTHRRAGEIQDYYYNLSYRPLKEAGKITGMIQVAVDVTEHVTARKKLEASEKKYRELSQTLERQVKDRTKELQRSNQDLQQFAHVASHDLKEPVRKIKMFASRLEDHLKEKMDDQTSRFIEKIHVATNRMFTMIDGVLTYSTANSGEQITERIDINEVIKNIEIDLEVTLQKTNGSIQYENLPTIEGASVLIYQLFYNLINNSLKFAKADTPPKITISSEMIEDKKGAKIVVQDNGIGFDAIDSNRIFETFIRLHSKDQYEGTGLGLSLCKKIVERHGGTLEANSVASEGASFTIILPLQQNKNDI